MSTSVIPAAAEIASALPPMQGNDLAGNGNDVGGNSGSKGRRSGVKK